MSASLTTRPSRLLSPIHAYIDPGTGVVVVTIGGWILGILAGLLGVFAIFAKRITRFFKRNWKPIAGLLLLILAAGAGFYLYTQQDKLDYAGRIIVVGFDGQDAKITEKLMAAGRMPNFAKLKQQGSYRRLATANPPQSPVAWATFATGKNPGKHGVFDFIQRDPKTLDLTISMSQFEEGQPQRPLQAKGFWEYASERGIPSTIVNMPVTFAPSPLKGKLLSGMGVPDLLGTEGTFTFYTDEPVTSEDTGGRVFQVRKTPTMHLKLYGPKVQGDNGPEHSTVPLTVKLTDDGATASFQDQTVQLELKRWSAWQTVSFDLGFLNEASGIFRFYLVETEPGFKLYISPINIDPRDPFYPISHPDDYSAELAEELGLYYTQGMPMDTWALSEERIDEKAFLEQVDIVVEEKLELLNHELNRFDQGILYLYFEDLDIVQHMFWRYTDPDHPLYVSDTTAGYGTVIEGWYEHMDRVLGRVMERVGEDDLLMVVSDHGFNTFRRAFHLNSWLRDNGYQALKDPNRKAGRELMADVDWENTQAYALGFGGIYLNLKGREPNGSVAPGGEAETLKQEIKRKLLTWRDPAPATAPTSGTAAAAATGPGRRVISTVYTNSELYWGPHAERAPDLFVGANEHYRASWQTALGAAPEGLVEDNLKKWSGTHLIEPDYVPGILFANRPVAATDPSLLDVAPSVLLELGFTEAELDELGIDGESFFAAPEVARAGD